MDDRPAELFVFRASEDILVTLERPAMARIVSLSVLLNLALVLCTSGFAQTVLINYTDRGWYDPTGFHNPSNLNYIVGDFRASHGYDDARNFFVFDLAGITQPIASAKLALFVPGPSIPGYDSGDPSENYELHDVTTPIASLVAGTGGVATHTDLGSGVVYGSRTMTAADLGNIVEVELNSSAITALNSSHGLIAIGGSLTTLDDVLNDEYAFAGTSNGPETTQLRLSLVPEPSTFLLLAIGAISLVGSRARRD